MRNQLYLLYLLYIPFYTLSILNLSVSDSAQVWPQLLSGEG